MKERPMSNFYGRHLQKYRTIQDNKVMCNHLHLILNKNQPFTVGSYGLFFFLAVGNLRAVLIRIFASHLNKLAVHGKLPLPYLDQ